MVSNGLQLFPYGFILEITAMDSATESPALCVLASALCCFVRGKICNLCVLENLYVACF